MAEPGAPRAPQRAPTMGWGLPAEPHARFYGACRKQLPAETAQPDSSLLCEEARGSSSTVLGPCPALPEAATHFLGSHKRW